MNDIRSKVMTAANRLVKGGMRRSLAMIKAWALAKASGLRIRVRGTAHRQSELEKLSVYSPDKITVQLRREPHNSHDKNAVAVYAAAPDRRVYFIGYLARAAAYVLAPLMDKGRELCIKGFAVVGGFCEHVNYGARAMVRV